MNSDEYDLLGAEVQVKAGTCGEGYRFRVTELYDTPQGVQVYGQNYGPVRASEVERVKERGAAEGERAMNSNEHNPVRKGRQCDLCRKHYKDTLGCDEGKPVASPHKTPGKEREFANERAIRLADSLAEATGQRVLAHESAILIPVRLAQSLLATIDAVGPLADAEVSRIRDALAYIAQCGDTGRQAREVLTEVVIRARQALEAK